ncbi:ABC transporter permease [uncultured Imperialibacter sp.]|uniref:ABC transporter permease n=1 Tax=uncultured Imperialibacter sp. TaxID=1672639 RepID=UPI0030DC68CF|tara:strand:+ start:38506 stop:41196 length:2691 start_codon:yes stop_codon:yes gene_type:complete
MSHEKHFPPPLALKFFRWYCRKDRLEELEGDLEESFYAMLHAGKAPGLAKLIYWWNVIRCFRSYAFKRSATYRSTNTYSMLTNYLKVIRRNFSKQRAHALLNISGLAIGFAAFILIAIYLHFETSFENFHTKSGQIYRLTVHYTSPSGYDTHFARVDTDWINGIPEEIPEAEKLIRFQNHEPKFIRIGEEKFRQDNAFVTDKDVFEVFDFPLTKGDAKTALAEPLSIVISEAVAEKYFANEDPMGKEIFITGYWSTDETVYKVTGVMKNLPANTHLPIDMLISFRNEAERSWWAYTYVLFQQGTNMESVQEKLEAMAIKINGDQALQGTEFVFQPLSDIHLHSNLAREIKPNGSIAYVKIFLLVAILILALAIINFMNLTSAMSIARSKEIGVRKILGAGSQQIVFYSLTESVLFSTAAAGLGLALAFLALPVFKELTGTENLLSSLVLVAVLFGLAVVTGLLGGFYPAFVLSSFKPVNIIKTSKAFSIGKKTGRFSIKRVLISLQFGISILLIASAMIARQQFVFLNEKNLGMEKDQVIALPGVPDTVKDKFKLFKDKLDGQPGIKGVSACLEVPSREIRDGGTVTAEGIQENADDAPSMDIQVIDHDFIDVMGMDLLAGEPLPKSLAYEPLPQLTGANNDVEEYLLSKRRAYILNETAMHAIGWQTPEEAIGKNVDWNQGTYKLAKGPVVGVVKDFHQETLKNKVDPIIMVFEPLWLRTFLVKLETNDVASTMSVIEGAWNELFPKYPFEYQFLDDLYNNLYKNERQQLQLLYLLSGLAITIAFIGLFGLIAYSLKTRVKEMAIRKVMGANFTSLIRLIGKEYLMVMLAGAALAIPLSYFWVSKWLENFAYRIDISVISYLMTLAGICLLLMATVALQTIKTAANNPADTLREE